MPGVTPLGEGWTLQGEGLPARLAQAQDAPGFSLPGAQELAAFASLLGMDEPDGSAQDAPGSPVPAAPYRLPALLPQEMTGTAELTREIDLRPCGADFAQLRFEHLTGRGTLLLDGSPAAAFDHGPLSLDLAPLLSGSRAHTLTLRFTDARPAGVSGPVLLHTAAHAALESVSLRCQNGSVTLRARIHALKSGCYQLRVLPCPADGALAAANPPAMREIAHTLCENETREAELSFHINDTEAGKLGNSRFIPGAPYAAPSVKLWLFRDGRQLCDSMTLQYGFPGRPPRAFLPLDAQDLRMPPQALADAVRALGVQGVYAAQPVSNPLARALLGGGLHLRLPRGMAEEDAARLARFPNIGTDADPLPRACADSTERAAASAWSLGGMTDHLRLPDPDALPAELIAELAGRSVDPASAHVQEVLAWLRAVRIRLNAEGALQGRFDGPLCDPGEWRQADAADALRTALSGVHLSALPLYGAWWTLSHFSASLFASIDEARLPAAVRASGGPIMAHASLEDDDGAVLAAFDGPCPQGGGAVGMLSAMLPERPCALMLHTRLTCQDAVIEQSAMPVYVGERGLLEAAFAGA